MSSDFGGLGINRRGTRTHQYKLGLMFMCFWLKHFPRADTQLPECFPSFNPIWKLLLILKTIRSWLCDHVYQLAITNLLITCSTVCLDRPNFDQVSVRYDHTALRLQFNKWVIICGCKHESSLFKKNGEEEKIILNILDCRKAKLLSILLFFCHSRFIL